MIDLYSDTTTRPTPAMRAAMAAAEVGDEQRRQDPTVIDLQRRVAELVGAEDAVFLPTGTMCNLVAIATHTHPGDAIVGDRRAHILRSETGGAAVVSSVIVDQIDGERGHFGPDQLRAALHPGSRYTPRTTVVCLEQTHNFAGGTVWPLDQWRAVCEVAHEAGAVVHVDGARLLNAVVASGVAAPVWGASVESIWIDFTKGLGAPIGAVLAGSAEFIDLAWQHKHRLGGAMRQSGIAAAGCLHALDHHVERLVDDHANAARLAEGLETLGVAVERPVDTNMVFFDASARGATAAELARHLEDRGVAVSEVMGRNRAVTHLDVATEDIDEALSIIATVLAGS